MVVGPPDLPVKARQQILLAEDAETPHVSIRRRRDVEPPYRLVPGPALAVEPGDPGQAPGPHLPLAIHGQRVDMVAGQAVRRGEGPPGLAVVPAQTRPRPHPHVPRRVGRQVGDRVRRIAGRRLPARPFADHHLHTAQPRARARAGHLRGRRRHRAGQPHVHHRGLAQSALLRAGRRVQGHLPGLLAGQPRGGQPQQHPQTDGDQPGTWWNDHDHDMTSVSRARCQGRGDHGARPRRRGA